MIQLIGFDPARSKDVARSGQIATGNPAAMTSRLETAIKITLTAAVGSIGKSFVSASTEAAMEAADRLGGQLKDETDGRSTAESETKPGELGDGEGSASDMESFQSCHSTPGRHDPMIPPPTVAYSSPARSSRVFSRKKISRNPFR